MKTLLVLLVLAIPAFTPTAHAQFGNAARIHGRPVDTVAPTQGQLLCYDASARKITWGTSSSCVASSGGGGGGALSLAALSNSDLLTLSDSTLLTLTN